MFHKSRVRKSTLMAAAVFAILATGPALAGTATGAATEWTQLLNNGELISLVGQSGEQVQNQITQITQLAEQIQLRHSDPLLRNGMDHAQRRWLRQLAFLLVDRLADLPDCHVARSRNSTKGPNGNEETICKDPRGDHTASGPVETGRDARGRAHRPHRPEGWPWRYRGQRRRSSGRFPGPGQKVSSGKARLERQG